MDVFDRVIGQIDGLPDVHKTRPTTVTTVVPMLGHSQTHVVQTYQNEEGEFTVFLQTVDAEGSTRLVIPAKVADAIYRQREALIKRGRTRRGRERWQAMAPEERRATVTRLQGARR